MKAMSYFTSSLARQGWYGMRPKVEMPEKTESAWRQVSTGSRIADCVPFHLPGYHHHQVGCCTTGSCAGQQQVPGPRARGRRARTRLLPMRQQS